MMSEWDAIVRLAVAVVLGGMIGFERETLNKDAGLRTHMLVTLGSAGFMVGSVLMVGLANPEGQVGRGDITRVASTIVTGIGFLAGGIIFKSESQVQGLTTAAGLWVAAAVGMLVGAGFYITAVGLTVLELFVLLVVHWGEARLTWMPTRSPRVRTQATAQATAPAAASAAASADTD
jgi:putative Mg2+ transporter-C (MgtC) family protein